jgi:hypothetical protein
MHAEALTVEMAAVAAPVEDIAVDEVAAMLVVVVAAVVVAAVVVAAVVVAEEATARKMIFFFFFFFFFRSQKKATKSTKRLPNQRKLHTVRAALYRDALSGLRSCRGGLLCRGCALLLCLIDIRTCQQRLHIALASNWRAWWLRRDLLLLRHR